MADGGKVVIKIDGDDSGFKKATSGLGKFASGALKGIAVGATAIGTAIIGIGTASIKAYAEYEQLAGGMETLFGARGAKTVEEYAKIVGSTVDQVGADFEMLQEAQKTAMDNAAGAYATAGVSANKYMEIATGMAAALNASSASQLESAQVANMAIQDMADNAAKMGTPLEDLQTAYAGFAKGQYMLLDNLKLGYGGTKGEMERLLAEAQALSGVEYDINNLTDVYEAIHVIQEEMGLTGVAADEAKTTIQGSIGMLKASWENLLTGLTNPDADLSVLFSQMIDSAKYVISNLLPAIQTVLPNIVTAFESLAPELISMIGGLLPQLIPAVIGVIGSLATAIAQALPTVIDTILQNLPTLIDAIVTGFGALVDALPSIIESIASALPTLIPQLITGIVQMVLTLVENFSSIIDPIISALPDIIISLVTAIVDNLPAIIDGIISLVLQIVEKIPEIIQALVDALPTVISLLIQAILNNLPKIIMGLIQVVWGIVRSLPQILGSLIQGVVNILAGIWDGLGKVFGNLGQWFGDKFGEAWTAIQNAWNGVVEWFSGIWDGIVGAFSAVGTWFSDLFSNAWSGIQDAWSGVTDWFGGIWDGISEAFSAVTTWFSDLFSKAWNGIKNAFSGAAQWATDVWNNIKNAFSNALEKFKEVGGNIVSGIWKGISDGFNWIKQKITGWVGNVLSFVKGLFGIKSPSTVFRDEVGLMISKGLAIGIEKGQTEVEKVMEDMNETLLESEQKYLEEKARLEKEADEKELQQKYDDAEKELRQAKEKASEALREDLKNAKNKAAKQKAYDKEAKSIREAEAKYAEKIEQIKQDNINEIAEKEQKTYLEGLKETADQERKIFEARQKDIENAQMAIRDTFTALAESAFDNIDELAEAQQSLEDKLKGFGELYETKTIKGRNREIEVVKLADIEAQTQALDNYAQALMDVKARGDVPKEFFNALRGMSVEEGTKFAKELLRIDDEAFTDYINDWKDKQSKADELSKILYADEAESVKEEISESFNKFSEDLDKQGEQNAEAWGEGFLAEVKRQIPNILSTINKAFGDIVGVPSYVLSNGGVPNYQFVGPTQPQMINVNAVMELDGRTFGRVTFGAVNNEARRLGTKVVLE